MCILSQDLLWKMWRNSQTESWTLRSSKGKITHSLLRCTSRQCIPLIWCLLNAKENHSLQIIKVINLLENLLSLFLYLRILALLRVLNKLRLKSRDLLIYSRGSIWRLISQLLLNVYHQQPLQLIRNNLPKKSSLLRDFASCAWRESFYPLRQKS